MSEAIDLKQEFIAAKSREIIIAFAGFSFNFAATGQSREGLLAVSSRERNDGSGYITLTFMIDAEGDPAAHRSIVQSFDALKKKGFRNSLGNEFQTMIEAEVDFERSQNWFMDSFTFYFDRVQEIRKYHVEGKLIPTFERFLPIRMDSVEWLPAGASVTVSGKKSTAGEATVRGFKRFLQGLFGT